MKRRHFSLCLFALLPPLLLVGLFQLLKSRTDLMARWVSGFMAPVEQFLGRLWSHLPFSVAEVLTALFLAGCMVWLVRAIVLLVRRRELAPFLRRLLALVAVWLWLCLRDERRLRRWLLLALILGVVIGFGMKQKYSVVIALVALLIDGLLRAPKKAAAVAAAAAIGFFAWSAVFDSFMYAHILDKEKAEEIYRTVKAKRESYLMQGEVNMDLALMESLLSQR